MQLFYNANNSSAVTCPHPSPHTHMQRFLGSYAAWTCMNTERSAQNNPIIQCNVVQIQEPSVNAGCWMN